MAGEACMSAEVIETAECMGVRRDAQHPVYVAGVDGHRHVVPIESIRMRAIGLLLVGVTSFNEQRRRRERRIAVPGGLDHYLVQLFGAHAQHGQADGADGPAATGDLCIFDLAQPLKSRLDAGATLSVLLPRPLLEKATSLRNLHGLVLKAESPMTSLVVACLQSLAALDASLPEAQAWAAQEALVTLLSAALNAPVSDEVRAASLAAGLRQRVVEFIGRNLCLLELSPDFLCRRFNVSRAHLYRAFAASGGVAKVLRDMRLDAAYRELTQASRDSRSITEMAGSLGFSSGNQLLRSFRARFGITPSEARASAVAGAK